MAMVVPGYRGSMVDERAQSDADDQSGEGRSRQRLIPRTALGVSMLILAAALGSAFSGAVLYAYYDYRLSKNEERLNRFVKGFDAQFKGATDTIAAAREDAKAQVRKELDPLQKVLAEGSTLENLVKRTAPSLWFVHTLDEAGQPSVGTAFVAASDGEQTLLVTSYTTVRAATRRPGPDVMVRQGGEDLKANLWTWQEDKDLALLILPKGGQPRLRWAPMTPPVRTGDRVFAMSGLGAAGGAITQGFVADVSSAGIQHSAPVGPSFQGGPIVTSQGEVVALSSRAYAPLGFTSDTVFYGASVRAVCERVLRCPNGDPNAPGDQR